ADRVWPRRDQPRGAAGDRIARMRRVAVLLVGLAIGVGVPGRARGDADGELAALIAGLPACDAARAHCIGIRLHVTVDAAGSAIAPAAWLASQLAAANRHFAPLEVGF